MNESMSTVGFQMMCLWFRLRDLLNPPETILSEADIRPGFHLLDYGCGPGSYSIAAADLVGNSGRVYAADINPLALQRLRSIASKRGLTNVETIHTDCATRLDESTVDVVLLYDTYHDLVDPGGVLQELHRVLKPGGVLSFSDHHMREEEILNAMTSGDLFGPSRAGKRTYSLSRID